MTVTTKTYRAIGLLEWELLLHADGASIPVHFSGGMMGSNGVIAASYTTSNAAIQHLIEHSAAFRKGRIRVERAN